MMKQANRSARAIAAAFGIAVCVSLAPGAAQAAEPAAMAAGTSGQPAVGRWVAGPIAGFSWFDNNEPSSSYSGTTATGGASLSYLSETGTIFGLAIAGERWDVKTGYDNGTLKSNGITVAPTILLPLMAHLSVDAGFSFGRLWNDETTNSGAVTASFGSRRYQPSLGLNANWVLPRDGGHSLVVGGRLGYMHMVLETDSYTDSGASGHAATSVTQGTLRADGRIGLQFSNGAQVYALGSFDWDVITPNKATVNAALGMVPNHDRTGFELGGGATVPLGTGGFFSARVTTILGRSHISAVAGNAAIGFHF